MLLAPADVIIEYGGARSNRKQDVDDRDKPGHDDL
jgi:hypothetical protein